MKARAAASASECAAAQPCQLACYDHTRNLQAAFGSAGSYNECLSWHRDACVHLGEAGAEDHASAGKRPPQ